MGRQCVVRGCRNNTTLYCFPVDADRRRQWLVALHLPDDIGNKAGVCNLHFRPESFSNRLEVDMGFIKVLKLKSDAVPIAPAHPVRPRGARLRPRELLPLSPPHPRPLAPRPTREIGCQTERVLTKHAFYQVDIKPHRRSKATEARPSNRDVSCDTGNTVGIEVDLEGDATSSFTDGSVDCTSRSNDATPKHIVYEDNLLELFRMCPVCSGSCLITRSVSGTSLQLKQTCHRCEYKHQWSSRPAVSGALDQNLQLSAAAQISEVLDAFKIQGISETTFQERQRKCLSNSKQ